MDILSPVVRHLIAPAWARWERSPYLRHYHALQQTQFDRPAEILARQWCDLQGIVQHAYRTVPFYRQRLDEAGITPGEMRTFHDFARIPCLTKADLREQGPQLISSAYAKARLTRKTTSGSTGVSVEVVVDEEAQQFKRGATLRSDEWSGWRLGQRVAMAWGNPEYLKRGWRGWLRNALLERRRYLDTVKLDIRDLEKFTASLRRSPPGLVFGHAHSLFLVAEFLRERGGAGFRPQGIISSAMVLHSWQRQVIEEVFGCPVTNRYGCEEVSLIACECEKHNGLHVNADGLFVEVLRPDGALAAPGEPGAVVVTDLKNRAMPILRYRVGDVAALSDRVCPCGRGLPMLERLEGREADYVVTADGAMISGISLTENFAMLIPGIAQLQIVQERLEHFVLRIVRGPLFGASSQARIRELVEERFGPRATFDCEFVERIPQERSGKYRFCISKVENPFTRSTRATSSCLQPSV